MSLVKIAQLSDLHCDGTQPWIDNFDYVINCLVEQKVNIVIITGDCADTPTDENYIALKDCIKKLNKNIEDLCLITIPGNHDCWDFKGNRIKPIKNALTFAACKAIPGVIIDKKYKSAAPNKKYQKYSKNFLFPQSLSLEKITEHCFKKYNIALYPLNSNNPKNLTVLAQGRVSQPNKAFHSFRNKYLKLVGRENYKPHASIAFLHHHLLPLPGDRLSEIQEMGMILQNPYNVLQEAQRVGVDMILHGHKHTSGISEYKNINSKSPLYVSSCGATTHIQGMEERELKILEISEYGIERILSFTAKEGEEVFEENVKHSSILRGYSKNREYFISKNISTKENQLNIKSATSKTKLVNIQTDGSSDVVLYINKIKWNESTNFDEKELSEQFRADIGRVVDVEYEFGPGPLIAPGFREVEIKSLTRPDEPELVTMEPIKPIHPTANIHCCKLKYTIYNGYTFNKRQLKEAYIWKTQRAEDESCSFHTDYPIETLDLMVTFPTQSPEENGCSSPYFPIAKNISIETIKKEAIPEGPNLIIFQADYDKYLVSEEMEELNKRSYLKIWPEKNQIGFSIKNPRPDLIYILRWGLPECTEDKKLNLKKSKEYLKLLNIIKNKDSPKMQEFYNSISKDLKTFFNSDNLKIVVFGYLEKEKLLAATFGPEGKTFGKSPPKLNVGRGIAGKSFRSRKVSYWSKQSLGLGLKIPSDHVSKSRIENIIPNLNAEAAVAFPLTMDHVAKLNEPLAAIPKCFGVVSIVTEDYNALSDYFDIEEGSRSNENAGISSILSYHLCKLLSD